MDTFSTISKVDDQDVSAEIVTNGSTASVVPNRRLEDSTETLIIRKLMSLPKYYSDPEAAVSP